jgi:antitoxin VapB
MAGFFVSGYVVSRRIDRDMLKGYTLIMAQSSVFTSNKSQAVRIPQEFRLDASRVRISRNEAGDLVIHPLAADRGAALLQALQAFDDALAADWLARLEADRREPLPAQERESL